jgi:acetoin utilization deacetylase AcuC-like enzyme
MGFDTYKDDMLGEFRLEVECYEKIGSCLAQLGLPVLFVQEGGYETEGLGDCAVSLLSGLSANYREA